MPNRQERKKKTESDVVIAPVPTAKPSNSAGKICTHEIKGVAREHEQTCTAGGRPAGGPIIKSHYL